MAATLIESRLFGAVPALPDEEPPPVPRQPAAVGAAQSRPGPLRAPV